MERVNALELRQSLGKVLAALGAGGEPIIVEKGRRPVAALISLKDFEERFVEKAASQARAEIMAEIDAIAMVSVDKTSSAQILRELRGSI